MIALRFAAYGNYNLQLLRNSEVSGFKLYRRCTERHVDKHIIL